MGMMCDTGNASNELSASITGSRKDTSRRCRSMIKGRDLAAENGQAGSPGQKADGLSSKFRHYVANQ